MNVEVVEKTGRHGAEFRGWFDKWLDSAKASCYTENTKGIRKGWTAREIETSIVDYVLRCSQSLTTQQPQYHQRASYISRRAAVQN